MRLPWKRPAVPAGVKDAVNLNSEEHVISIARGGEDNYLVATSVGLYLVTPSDSGVSDEYSVPFTVRWDQVDKARWEAPVLQLDLSPTAVAGQDRTVELEIDQASQLPAAIRDRVNDSIVASDQIPVLDGTARVVARRRSDTGDTGWRVILGPGLDPNDPEVRQAASDGLAAYRERLGV